MTRSHTAGQSGWFTVGGTSAAAPAWAGLVAITDQGLATAGKSTLSTSQTLSDLYSLPSSDFNDITSGFNGYSATKGYDLVTGLATPKSNLVVAGLLSVNGVSSNTTKTSALTTVSVSSGSTSSHHAFETVLAITTATTTVETVATALPVEVVGVLQTQTTSTSNDASNAQDNQQSSSTTTTTVSASAATTTSLGQSVSQATTTSTSSQGTEDDSETLLPIDNSEPAMPPAPDSKTPTDKAPAPDAAPQKGPEPKTTPEAPAAPIESIPDPLPTLFDAALEAILADRSSRRWQRSNEPRIVEPERPRENLESATSTPSTLAGTAAVAAAGLYWSTLRQADRKKGRWIPGRI